MVRKGLHQTLPWPGLGDFGYGGAVLSLDWQAPFVIPLEGFAPTPVVRRLGGDGLLTGGAQVFLTPSPLYQDCHISPPFMPRLYHINIMVSRPKHKERLKISLSKVLEQI